MHLFIFDIQRLLCEIDISPESTVSDLKQMVAEKIKENSVDKLSIVFRGKILSDTRTISSYNIQDGYKLYISFSKTSAKGQTTQTKPKTQPNSSGNFMDQYGPMISQMIQQNPELVGDIMEANPALKKIVDDNPQMKHLLNDNEMISEEVSKLLNPENREETAKTLDNMLDYIESIPGGFSELNHTMNSIGNPMLDSLTSNFSAPIKTNLDIKPLEKPSEDPLPYQQPVQQSPLANMFNQFFNWDANAQQQQQQQPPQPPLKATQIPYEAMHLINQGVEKCRQKGLNVSEFPGFRELVDICQKNDPYGASDLNVVFASQLQQLQEMGFYDNKANIKLLVQAKGDVTQVLELMIANQPFYM